MRTNLLGCILLFAQLSSAQQWQWTKRTPPFEFYPYGDEQRVVTVNNNIYLFAARMYHPWYVDILTDTVGTQLQAYSPSGNLLFTKHWKIPFYIREIVFDGTSNLYFSAVVYGNQVIDGIPVTSHGSGDGVIGQMDLSGNISWMRSFGGPGTDQAYCIYYDRNDNTIYAGGQIADTLFFDQAFHSVNEQSALILHYSSTGQRSAERLYDFKPGSNYSLNSVRDIDRDRWGNFFVMMDRQGESWSNWPYTGPVEGRYMMKLAPSLDTLWTNYIIGPSCYYGMSCTGLGVAANGDAYVASFCSGKYGGSGNLHRLDGNTGQIKWSYLNSDGAYSGLVLDSNTVYLVGNEGANGCPCPGSTPGYYVVKMIDEDNSVLGETRVEGAYIRAVNTDKSGSIFVSGWINRNHVLFGPDTVDLNSPQSTCFISKLSTLSCQPTTITSQTALDYYGHTYVICPGQSAILSVSPVLGTYNWSNGASGPNVKIFEEGNYAVINTQPNGCVAYSLPIPVAINKYDKAPPIYLVTYNENLDRNMMVVGPPDYASDIHEINVYRDTGSALMLVGKRTGKYLYYEALTDTVSDPNLGPVNYYVSSTDTCGNASPLSSLHSSIFLSVSRDINAKNVLNWTPESGHINNGYKIWKGSTPNTLSLVTTLGSTITSWLDAQSGAGTYYYQVEAITYSFGYMHDVGQFLDNCASNIVASKGTSSVISYLAALQSVCTYPNPVKGCLMLDHLPANTTVLLYNVVGELVMSENFGSMPADKKQFDLSALPAGVYLLELEADGGHVTRKVMKQ